jgi:hypothetical protein
MLGRRCHFPLNPHNAQFSREMPLIQNDCLHFPSKGKNWNVI